MNDNFLSKDQIDKKKPQREESMLGRATFITTPIPKDSRMTIGNDEYVKLHLNKPSPSKSKPRKNNTSLPTKNCDAIFENKNFVFVPFGVDLSRKRIEIFSTNIEKRGGIVMPYSGFVWNKTMNSQVFLLLSKEMSQQAFENTVPAIFHPELAYFKFFNCEWISACIQQNKLIDPEAFEISWFQNTSEKTECLSSDADDMQEEEEKVAVERNSPKDHQEILIEEDEGGMDQDSTRNTTMKEENPQIKTENPAYKKEFKIEYQMKNEYVKFETLIKRENRIKKEGGPIKIEEYSKRDFTYILSDDDEDVQFTGKNQKKIKFEEEDVQGTILEDVEEIDKINTDKDGEVFELKELKVFQGSRRLRHKMDGPKEGRLKKGKEEIFICKTGMKQNLNAHITDELEKVWNAYIVLKDEDKEVGYGRIISIIKAMPKKIKSVEDVKGIVGLGTKMAKKIKEILQTGKLRKAEKMQNDDKVKVLTLFYSIWGVGPATAFKFYQKGFRTIEDLKNNPHVLDEWQKLGIKYHADFQKKVPRAEVAEMFRLVQEKIEELSEHKGEFEAICGGSYRRGRAMCSDLDVVMSRRDEKPVIGFLAKLLKRSSCSIRNLLTYYPNSLEGTLLVEHITWPKPESNGGESYMGVCILNGIYHRIDIRIYPRDQFGPAICFFTGSEWFNRSMKLFAKRKGLNLENYGLYPAIRLRGGEKYSQQCIPCHSEEDVFKKLGLKYIPPDERDI